MLAPIQISILAEWRIDDVLANPIESVMSPARCSAVFKGSELLKGGHYFGSPSPSNRHASLYSPLRSENFRILVSR